MPGPSDFNLRLRSITALVSVMYNGVQENEILVTVLSRKRSLTETLMPTIALILASIVITAILVKA